MSQRDWEQSNNSRPCMTVSKYPYNVSCFIVESLTLEVPINADTPCRAFGVNSLEIQLTIFFHSYAISALCAWQIPKWCSLDLKSSIFNSLSITLVSCGSRPTLGAHEKRAKGSCWVWFWKVGGEGVPRDATSSLWPYVWICRLICLANWGR